MAWTNQSKNNSVFLNQNKPGFALWGDTIATWGDPIYAWGGNPTNYGNQTKNTSVFTMQTKN